MSSYLRLNHLVIMYNQLFSSDTDDLIISSDERD